MEQNTQFTTNRKLELNSFPATTPSHKGSLLFLHGMSHAAWCWEWCFVPYFQSLGYHCYTLSYRGHGNSWGVARRRWWRIADYVEDVKEALLRVPDAIVVSHSMGGFILQKLLLEGMALRAGVLLSPIPPGGMWKGSLKTAIKFPLKFIRGNLSLSTDPFAETPFAVQTLCFSADISSDMLLRTQAALHSESYRAYLDLLFMDLHNAKVVDVPLLFLHGEHDFLLDREVLAKAATAFGAEFESLPAVAHDMMLDTRWQTVAQRVAQWLDQL
ncbi:MAG: alpha/beta hydrolase [Chitinophagales bacterium]